MESASKERKLSVPEHAGVTEEALAAAVAHARSCLSGIDEPAELVGDRRRPAVRSNRLRSATFPLPAAAAAAAGEVARRLEVGEDAVYLAAFAALALRHTRAHDLVVSRRVRAEGARDNHVLVRAHVDLSTTVADHVRAIADGSRRAEAHAAVPIEAVLGALASTRDATRAGGAGFAFTYAARPAGGEPATAEAGVDLGVAIDRAPDGAVAVTVLENEDLFTDGGRAGRAVGHLAALLEGFAASLDAAVARIPIVRGAERDALVSPHGALQAFPSEDTLATRVERAALRAPGAVALVCGDERVTYGDLEARATRIARRLRALGVGRDDRIGIVMERTPRLVVALYAILKAGGAYVPVEPTQPRDRIEFVLGDTQPKVVLTDSASAGAFELPGVPTIRVDELERELAGEPDAPLPPPACPEGASPADALAYVIYTSGSTGRPKGCLLQHRDVVRLLDATHAWYRFDERDVWTFFHSVAFDFSVWEIWGALAFGGRLVVVPYPVTRSPEDFRRLLGAEGVTILNQTPSAFRQLIAADAVVTEPKLALREVIFGGEALDMESLRPWFDRHGDTSPRLVNMYGITETTVFVTYRPLSRADLASDHVSVIGVPIPDVAVYVVDEALELVPVGVPGELLVSAAGISQGYWRRPELTAEKFLPDRFDPRRGRLYRSGDLVKRLPNGEIDYLGRIDQQVKISGYRIEMGEVEAALRKTGLVRDVVVVAAKKEGGESALVAYVVTDGAAHELRARTRELLPGYMVPSVFVPVPAIPMTDNGKVDRRALPDPFAGQLEEPAEASFVPVRGRFEQAIAEVYAEILKRSRVGASFHFFEEGGSSLGAVHAALRIGERLGVHVPVVKLFQHPTVETLARHLERGDAGAADATATTAQGAAAAGSDEPIAIIGLAGRFPGANDVETFWDNLLASKESIRFFTREELSPALDPEITGAPTYVLARGVLDAPADFDAAFFGMSPREAEITDPQQRLALELAWEALESAGYDPSRYRGAVGVYAGEHALSYYIQHLLPRPDVVKKTGEFLAMLGNEKDYIATRIAYKLDLRGPALSVHSACSTSLVAVANAFFALRTGQCDMAIAGGVSITHPTASGYEYQEEGISSPDGHTRPFDASAQGTVFSDGAAFVVMKRLGDALRDGDTILALVRGAATNNDGGERVSFMAPTPTGQADVVRRALASAGVPPRTIGYVEAHGTATPIGDPIEVEGLKQAFGADVPAGNCGIGSVKSNIGHLAAAAGATGLVKATLAVKHGVIPPTIHFEKANPKLALEASPFHVVSRTSLFPRKGAPRRAGVSAFGVGGTNAHVIIEEPPGDEAERPARREASLFVVSARSPSAVAAASARLARRFQDGILDATLDATALADAAYTLAVGRKAFEHRRFVVAKSADEARRGLEAAAPSIAARARPTFAFAFPGQGSQYLAMGRELCAREPVFREAYRACLDILASGQDGPGGPLACDLSGVLDPAGPRPEVEPEFVETAKVQPAIFAVEWALAKLWLSLGVTPDVLLGHSIGEIVAATLSGVFELEDALRFVFHRGRLMQAAPPGVMLSVRAAPGDIEADVAALGSPESAIAVVNAPKLCVVGGPDDAMTALAERLAARGVPTSRLRVSHAFHTPMMDGVLGELEAVARAIPLRAPRIPIVSTVTGQRLGDDAATSPDYWARHVREAVRFSDALATVWREDPDRVVIEVGPRATLTTVGRQTATDPKRNVSFASMEAGSGTDGRDPEESAAFLRAVGQAWAHGATIDWAALHAGEVRRRVPLPTYPFERKTYLVEAPTFAERASGAPRAAAPVAEGAAAPAADAGAPAAAEPMDRRTALMNAVKSVFEEASGVEVTDPTATFMELGLDSLSLTQCAQVLGRRVGGDVTFRQLVEGLVTLDALVSHLEASLPADYVPRPGAAPAAAGPAPAAEAGAPGDAPPEAATKKAFGAGARIERTGTALPHEQEVALDEFMKAYVARTRRSKAYAAEHRDVLADPRVVTGFKPMWKEVVYPIVVERSEGSHLWDLDGNEWIDLTCGFGANFLGHRPPYVVKAVHEQLDRGFEIGPQHPLVGDCARLLQEITGHERVVFCNTGTEAILGATRLARTISGRPDIVSFNGDYHGILDEVILRGTKSLRSIPGAPGILPSAVQHNLVLDYGDRAALGHIRARARDIAAVVVEPVQSRHPELQPRAFLRELRELTTELGIALVFDEIVTGFRLCPGGAQEYFGVRADIATYGKILGGGLPIGAIAGRHEYMDALDGGAWQYGDASVPEVGVTYFAGTFVRHPLALAACKASLEHVKAAGPALQREITARTANLVAGINADLRRAEAPYRLQTCGSWFKLDYPDDLPFGGLLFFWLRQKGLHIWDGRVAFLTTAHTDDDCAKIRAAFAAAVREMQAAGFLPRPTRTDAFAVRPAPDARLGKDRDGSPAWFSPDPARPGKYLIHRRLHAAGGVS